MGNLCNFQLFESNIEEWLLQPSKTVKLPAGKKKKRKLSLTFLVTFRAFEKEFLPSPYGLSISEITEIVMLNVQRFYFTI